MDTLLTAYEVEKALGELPKDMNPVGTYIPPSNGKPVKLYSGAEVQRRVRK